MVWMLMTNNEPTMSEQVTQNPQSLTWNCMCVTKEVYTAKKKERVVH